ncbi:hypothetical protein AKO1_013138 [Acrasis kona]|uniref:Uncharacterized protein n=1 Tax=Acrasis kona TaxID=1008807 RepID=A0AAW2YMF2_9EUKA
MKIVNLRDYKTHFFAKQLEGLIHNLSDNALEWNDESSLDSSKALDFMVVRESGDFTDSVGFDDDTFE